jgi:nicotinate phosphoribosyltransferase
VTTSADAPSLDCAYKLQEYAGRPCRKRSEGKATWPGRKQVYRYRGVNGRFEHDVVTTLDDRLGGEPLLHPVMNNGRRLTPPPDLADLRRRTEVQLAQLPEFLRAIGTAAGYEVQISPALHTLAEAVDLSL